MTNYFEIWDKRLTAIEANQQEILARLSSANATSTEEIGGIELATQITRLSKPRIYTLVSERAIPHKKRGNRLTFRRSELLDWLDQGNRKTIEGPRL
ncbi:helix-turn-helix domain-containing protein [Fibrella aestuarina]|uniref:helix-turn-helix domain-containing protein n=1 Tax=Fibrella aestuarina TaxID=651143 RepID=UPI000686F993|nr:helix-turn-helix domain-containing protein [Fibrella aestuarina]